MQNESPTNEVICSERLIAHCDASTRTIQGLVHPYKTMNCDPMIIWCMIKFKKLVGFKYQPKGSFPSNLEASRFKE